MSPWWKRLVSTTYYPTQESVRHFFDTYYISKYKLFGLKPSSVYSYISLLLKNIFLQKTERFSITGFDIKCWKLTIFIFSLSCQTDWHALEYLVVKKYCWYTAIYRRMLKKNLLCFWNNPKNNMTYQINSFQTQCFFLYTLYFIFSTPNLTKISTSNRRPTTIII